MNLKSQEERTDSARMVEPNYQLSGASALRYGVDHDQQQQQQTGYPVSVTTA